MLRIVWLIILLLFSPLSIMNGVGQGFIERLPSKVAILTQEDKAYMAFPYKANENFWVEFAPRGANNLMGISKLILTPYRHIWTMEGFEQVQKEEILDACTDWVGPYMVRKGLEPPNVKAEFTGGWHALENDTVATARTVSHQVIGTRLMVINRIQGYNTTDSKEDILEEHVTYTVTEDGINVKVIIKALTDCTIERYYGLQSQNSFHDGKIIYRGSEDTPYAPDVISYALTHKDVTEKVYSVYSKNGKHRLKVTLDAGYGLGKGDYVAKDVPYAFTVTYNKSYFNLVNSRELPMKKGETTKWRGKYSFQYMD